MAIRRWKFHMSTCLGGLVLLLVVFAMDSNSSLYMPKFSALSSDPGAKSYEQDELQQVGKDWLDVDKEVQGYGGLLGTNKEVEETHGNAHDGELADQQGAIHQNVRGNLSSEHAIENPEFIEIQVEHREKEEVQPRDSYMQEGGRNPATLYTKDMKISVNYSSEDELENCDISIGSWRDTITPPAYTAQSCRFIAPERKCEHKVDTRYLRRQWVPSECPLPWPLEGNKLLEILRNKIVLIIGDVTSTTFGEALACGLSTFTEVDGRLDTSHGLPKEEALNSLLENHSISKLPRKNRMYGSHMYYIKSYNITVKQLQVDWLVAWDDSPDAFRRAGVVFENNRVLLNLDRVDSRWGDAVNESVHILILSSGSMWHSKTRKIFRNNGDVVYLDWSQGYRFSLETARSFIERSSFKGIKVFRTVSPAHWLDDRHQTCAMESDVLPEEQTALVVLAREQCLDIQNELFNPLTGWKTLDISEMSLERMDAHPSLLPQPATSGGRRKLLRRTRQRRKSKPRSKITKPVSDCAGWCLPGVPDHWVSLLHALLAQPSNLTIEFLN